MQAYFFITNVPRGTLWKWHIKLLISCILLLSISSRAEQKKNPASDSGVHVVFSTELGNFEVVVFPKKAPITVANFLKYVDSGYYNGGVFHRTVKMDNQPGKNVLIEVVQASADPSKRELPPIVLERTNKTGIKHRDGTMSMARDAADTATSDFFICINDQPELDFGGKRNPDGQGFAAFGNVVSGMDVIRKIQASPADGQRLTPPIRIISAKGKLATAATKTSADATKKSK